MARTIKNQEVSEDQQEDVQQVIEDQAEASTEATEATEEEEPDLTAFIEAVSASKANADEATGTVPEADIDATRVQYQLLPGVKAKNAAKAYLRSELNKAMEDQDIVTAFVYMSLTEKAAVAGKPPAPKRERKVVDPTIGYTEALTALTLGFYLATSNAPEGVDLEKAKADSANKANELFAAATEAFQSEDRKSDDPLINKAIRFATAKAVRRSRGGTYAGPRRDVAKHIAEAVAAHEPGAFLTLADLRAFRSTEYGDDAPSGGALANRLEPPNGAKPTLTGIVVERRDDESGKSRLGVVVQ